MARQDATVEYNQRYRQLVLRDIAAAGNGTAGNPATGAPSPHAIDSAHHSGVLADSQAPQFLMANGARPLTGNLAVNSGVTIDGVDLSAFKAAYDAFVPTVVLQTRTITAGAGLTGGGDLSANRTLDVGAGSGISVAADAVSVDSTVARSTWQINAGAGLTGGGFLSSSGPTLDVGAGSGISVAADSVAIDQAFSPIWSGTHQFNSTVNASSVLPRTTDTYDLGSSTKLWRKAWIAELDAVIFAENTVSLVGGWLVVSKDQGVLAADLSNVATSANFGRTMTPNDFVLFRAAGQVEYVQVGTLVSGTTYNITRNLDGSGANTWPAGTAFMVLGTTGNGWLELNASDTPRLSIFLQGASYNARTEVARLGDLNGAYGVATELYGVGLGDYAGGNYLKYDTTNNFEIKAGNSAVHINTNGVGVELNNSFVSRARAYAFTVTSGGVETEYGGLYGTSTALSHSVQLINPSITGKTSNLTISNDAPSGKDADIGITISSGATTKALSLVVPSAGTNYLQSNFDANYLRGGLSMGATSLAVSAGDVGYSGNMRPYRNSTLYTAYPMVILTSPLTSVNWDGDDTKTAGTTYTIDTSVEFGAPAGIRAILIRLVGTWATASASNTATVQPAGTTTAVAALRSQVNAIPVENTWLIPCDSNGDIAIIINGANMTSARLTVWGYCI